MSEPKPSREATVAHAELLGSWCPHTSSKWPAINCPKCVQLKFDAFAAERVEEALRDKNVALGPIVGANTIRKQGAEIDALKAQLANYEDKEMWTGCGSGDCPHESVHQCTDALVKALAGEIATTEDLRAQLAAQAEDTARLDWFDGQHGDIDHEGCMHSVLVRPGLTTREAMDHARNATPNEEEQG